MRGNSGCEIMYIAPDGTETGLNAFRVRVRKQTVTARTPSGKTVPFCRFAKGE